VPLIVGWLAYRGVVQVAVAYAEAIDVAFDLNRFDMLKALHLDLPVDLTAEREIAERLCDLWRQGTRVTLAYHHDELKKEVGRGKRRGCQARRYGGFRA